MLKLVTKTQMSPGEVVKKAVEFFGADGYGLELKEEGADFALFEGGGGVVGISASPEGEKTQVTLDSREWDFQVKEFIGKIGGSA